MATALGDVMLRNTTPADAAVIFSIAYCEPPEASHGFTPTMRWAQDMTARASTYIVLLLGRDVGYLSVGDYGEIEIALLPSARGCGIGPEALRLLTAMHSGRYAKVREINHAALAAFRKAGFTGDERTGDCVLLHAPR